MLMTEETSQNRAVYKEMHATDSEKTTKGKSSELT